MDATRRALWIPGGGLVWAAHFAVLYGFTAFACARGHAGAVPWVIAAATLVALAALGALGFIGLRQGRRNAFSSWMTAAVAAVALVAVVFQALPAFFVPACA